MDQVADSIWFHQTRNDLIQLSVSLTFSGQACARLLQGSFTLISSSLRIYSKDICYTSHCFKMNSETLVIGLLLFFFGIIFIANSVEFSEESNIYLQFYIS